jgi:hypothetical protein
MDAVRPLNYAPKPSIRQRFSRRVYRLILVAALATAAITWGPGIWRHSQLVYWEYQCLHFSQPPEHLVWEMNRGNVQHAEVCLPRIQFLGLGAVHATDGTIFLHEMRGPDGTQYLVSLIFSPLYQSESNQFRLQYLQWNVSPWPHLSIWNYINVKCAGSAQSHYKFFAGQPDPNNASHLTFDYEIDGQRHTCDGWLNNDGQLIVSQRP